MDDALIEATKRQTAATLAAAIIAASGRPWSIEQTLGLDRDIYNAMHPIPNSGIYQEWAKTKEARLSKIHGPQITGRSRIRVLPSHGGAMRLDRVSGQPPFQVARLVGQRVILGVDEYSDFNALHSGKHNEEVQLCAFDVLAMAGDDLRAIPLSMRKANLARLLARRPDGIFISDFEEGEIGPDLFPSRLPNGIGRFGIETTGSSISVRPVKALGEGEEPKASGDEAGDGFVRMIENHRDRFNHKEPSTSTDASPRI